MKVRLLEIDEHPSHFTFQIQRKELEKLEDRFDFDLLDCEAQIRRNLEFIELKGQYRVSLSTHCDFCLEPVKLELDQTFRLDLVAEGSHSDLSGDVELSMDSPELDYYSGEELYLTGYFEDQLVLDLPFNIRCDENCKGLCTTCGGNLNHEQCDCHKKSANNPFAVLKDLKPKT